jgi:histidine ammonia-lyase
MKVERKINLGGTLIAQALRSRSCALALVREGAPIYGVSTGLWAAVDTRVRAEG